MVDNSEAPEQSTPQLLKHVLQAHVDLDAAQTDLAREIAVLQGHIGSLAAPALIVNQSFSKVVTAHALVTARQMTMNHKLSTVFLNTLTESQLDRPSDSASRATTPAHSRLGEGDSEPPQWAKDLAASVQLLHDEAPYWAVDLQESADQLMNVYEREKENDNEEDEDMYEDEEEDSVVAKIDEEADTMVIKLNNESIIAKLEYYSLSTTGTPKERLARLLMRTGLPAGHYH